jgi:hypothetical protein
VATDAFGRTLRIVRHIIKVLMKLGGCIKKEYPLFPKVTAVTADAFGRTLRIVSNIIKVLMKLGGCIKKEYPLFL